MTQELQHTLLPEASVEGLSESHRPTEADLLVRPKELCQVVVAKPGSPVLRRAAVARLQGGVRASCQQRRGVLQAAFPSGRHQRCRT